jgi:putative DNA methylase
MITTKKLIEVALPLDAINDEGSRRKRKAPSGYPTALHKWWAQRPVAAARGVIFAQLVDDPSGHPDLFPTPMKQQKERERLFRIIEDLVLWENTGNEAVLQRARDEIWQSWRYACAANADHPRAKELFDRNKLPAFHDPFAGSGSIPLEAQRLGLEVFASDLNPVAVLINKAMIEIPHKFAGKPPVNPEARSDRHLFNKQWKVADGLAEDVRYYGQWMCHQAKRRIGHLYPTVEITVQMAEGRRDLKPLLGQKLNVVAWLWARTVESPNPAFAHVEVPLATTFLLATRLGKEAYVEPVIEQRGYRFTVKVGRPKDSEGTRVGTKLGRGSFRCLLSGVPISYEYIDDKANAGKMGSRLMAVVAEGERGRVYLGPTPEQEAAARNAQPRWRPDSPSRGTWASNAQGRRYGFRTFGDYFTPRQLVALTTFSDLIGEVVTHIHRDAVTSGLRDDEKHLHDGGVGATAYAEAACTYLSMVLSRLVDYGSSMATWRPKDSAMRSTMPKQAIQMAWDFAEGSPFGDSSSGFLQCVQVVAKVIGTALTVGHGVALQRNVGDVLLAKNGTAIVSTDPPYYDNVGYADLSDFYYVWLRRSLRSIFPDLFSTLVVPKAEELVATPYRHQSEAEADEFFLNGMTQAMQRMAEQTHPAFPVTVYYAFKQSETQSEEGTASTGWEKFLAALNKAGLAINGTWPMRTEGDNRQVGIGSNALASSIVLVCRPRSVDAPTVTRREFVSALKAELPAALAHLQRGNIAPVDLAQAAIGPGMAVYTRYSKVLDAQGNPLSVREALALINQVLDEVLAEQESDFDADSRWALAWFEHAGFADGEYGVAETLSKAKNTSVAGLVEAGFLASSRGKVRLLKPEELQANWDPATDTRFTAWETVHQLIRVLEKGGEGAAAFLVGKLQSKAETARELCYRLYTICERKKRAAEALSYNALVQSWPEITRLAREGGKPRETQTTFIEGDEE